MPRRLSSLRRKNPNSRSEILSDDRSVLTKRPEPCMSDSPLELMARHLTTAELEAGLDEIRRAPRDEGVLELIVRRPQVDEREVLDTGELTLESGLVGGSWIARGSSRTPGGSPHPDRQPNLRNSPRTAAA